MCVGEWDLKEQVLPFYNIDFLLLSKSVLRVKMILCVCVWACGHSISSPMAQAVIVTAAVLITDHGSPSKKVIFEFCFYMLKYTIVPTAEWEWVVICGGR